MLRLHAPSLRLSQTLLRGPALRYPPLSAAAGDPRAALITALFGSGEQGALYDPSDSSTVFQERTGASATTPAGADDPVGTMLDLSGNGNHATAPSDAARPLRKTAGGLWWLESDGVDDILTASIAASAAQSWFLAVKSDSTTSTTGRIFSRAATVSIYDNNGTWAYYSNQANGVVSFNTNARTAATVLSILAESASSVKAYANGALAASYDPNDTVTTSTIINLYAISAGNNPLQGRVYGNAIVNRAVTSDERSKAEQWLASKAGVTL